MILNKVLLIFLDFVICYDPNPINSVVNQTVNTELLNNLSTDCVFNTHKFSKISYLDLQRKLIYHMDKVKGDQDF